MKKYIKSYRRYLQYILYTIILIFIELPCWLFILLIVYIAPLSITSKIINVHTKFFLRLFRIKIKYNFNEQNKINIKKFDPLGSMLISNHISWIDILAMLGAYNKISFIAKAELKKWPILGKIIIKYNTIFVQQNRFELKNINLSIANQINNGLLVAVFPEGETTDGKTVYQFKSAIFQGAINAECAVIPLVINYLDKNGNNIAPTITYSKKNLFRSIKDTIYNTPFVIEITELPVINTSNFTNRNHLRDHVEQTIKEYYLKVIT